MKTSSLCTLLCLSFVLQASALPVDLSIPAHGLGAASINGNAEHWLELGDFSFGQGVLLPLRLSFDSARVGGPTDFGRGSPWWNAPELHARILQKVGDRRIVLLPCGKMLHLFPQGTAFATPDGEWTGTYDDRGALVVSRADGWALEYAATGWLVRLHTDTRRVIDWNRADNGQLISITEAAAGAKPGTAGLLLRRDEAGRVTGFDLSTETGPKTWTLTYDSEQRLGGVVFPDGTRETYDYTTDKAGNPKMSLTGRDLAPESLAWSKTTAPWWRTASGHTMSHHLRSPAATRA